MYHSFNTPRQEFTFVLYMYTYMLRTAPDITDLGFDYNLDLVRPRFVSLRIALNELYHSNLMFSGFL